MTTFVLVHGAYHGGWCWRDFAPLLEAGGHRVLTPTLTGLGDRYGEVTRDVGLQTHVADIISVYEQGNLAETVLLGHSYGGAVVAAVADRLPEQVASLVFLDAIIPEDGKSVLDFQYPERRQQFLDSAETFNGWQIPPPDISLYGVTDPLQKAWCNDNCVPQPLKAFTETSVLTGAWATVPRLAYIRCTQPSLPYMDQFQGAAGAAGWDIHEIATGHDCMITQPQELADILLTYAA
jgi:pimeloyl-ACP methyl ester carboxylesterase